MCGRYKLSRADKAQLAEHFGIDAAEIPDHADEIDNAPGSVRFAIDIENGERKWTAMRWGFVAEIDGRRQLVFNAKAESMRIPRWRAILRNRCIIPASGFFEWQKVNGKPGAKFEITVPGEPVFGFAGLFDDLPNPRTREMERTFWIITTAPNARFAALHNRQPVILDPAEYEEWLTSPQPPLHLLRVFPAEKMLITQLSGAPEPKPKARKARAQEPLLPGLFDEMDSV